jgi:nitroreductase
VSNDSEAKAIRAVISRRRVTRSYENDPVRDEELLQLAETVYWAPSGGGRRPVRVVIVREREQMHRVIAFSPGIIGMPPALLVLCVDWSRAPHLRPDDPRDTHATHVDVGAATSQILMLAEAMGLGACPVMSFHRASVRTVLSVPRDWTPLVLVTVGYRAGSPPPTRTRSTPDGVMYWERVGEGLNARNLK